MNHNRRFILKARPEGLPKESDFALTTENIPSLNEGEFLVRNQYASIDPAIRGWLEPSGNYMEPVAIDDAVRASTIGIVEDSRHPSFKPGQWVMGLNKIEYYSVARDDGFTHVIDVTAVPSPTAYLSVAGAVGLTAWFGVENVMQPHEGQTLLVSGAAGAVGSLIGQLAKRRGARVIGIAGGAEKCTRLIHRYGYDAAIDYRGKDAEALSRAIADTCPGGVDFVYENIGGICLDAALMNIRVGALIVICGLISEYNSAPYGTRNIWQLLVKTATMRGYLLTQFLDQFPQGTKAMATLAREGALVYDEHIDDGIDNALPALLRLFEGSNQGKMILKLA